MCARWHCHGGAVGHRHPLEDAVYIMPGRLKETVVDIPVSRNRLSVLKRHGGYVAECCKETRYHLFGSTSVSFQFHRWVLIWEDPHPSTAASSRGCIGIPRFRLLLRYPRRENTFLKIFLHVGAPVHPTSLLLFTQVKWHPAGTSIPYAKAVVKNANETSQ